MNIAVQVAIAWAVLPPLVAVAIHVLCRGGGPQPTDPPAARVPATPGPSWHCPDSFVVLNDGRLAEVWQ